MIMLTEKEISELPLLLTVDQARQILGVGKSMMYELIRQNNIPYIKLSPRSTRIPKNDLLEWISSNIK